MDIQIDQRIEVTKPTGILSCQWVNLSFSIMGVPSRIDNVRNIQKQLPGCGMSIDMREQKPGRKVDLWQNALASWYNYHPQATHHAVIQDDVTLCRQFADISAYLAYKQPSQIISPFTMKGHVNKALDQKLHWVYDEVGIYGQCSIWPVSLLTQALDWIGRNIHPSYKHDDCRFRYFLQYFGLGVMQTAPVLLSHDYEHSLLGHPPTPHTRKEKAFIGDISPWAIDWRKGLRKPYKSNGSLTPLPDEYYLNEEGFVP